MNYRYWSFDGEETTFHETEDEAERAAESVLEAMREQAQEGYSDGWSELVELVSWGCILGRVTEAPEPLLRTADEDEELEEVVDYVLERLDDDA